MANKTVRHYNINWLSVGFYWTISNVIAILQQIYIFKVHPPKRTQAKLMVENTIERRSREENIKKMTK